MLAATFHVIGQKQLELFPRAVLRRIGKLQFFLIPLANLLFFLFRTSSSASRSLSRIEESLFRLLMVRASNQHSWEA